MTIRRPGFLLIAALLLAGCGSIPNGMSPQKIAGAITGPCSPPVGYANPMWSPDGTRIAFEAYLASGGGRDIMTMHPDGSAKTPVTSDGLDNSLGAWSPDGRRIVYLATQLLRIADADGANPVWLPLYQGADSAPTWSPDGRQIAFRAQPGPQIAVMNPDGTGARTVVGSGLMDGPQIWSPDGKQIAFVFTPDGSLHQDIAVVDVASGHITRLTDNQAIDIHPAWAPDGKHIAFQSNRDGVQAIYLMDVDGKNQTRLTTEGANDYAPVWSPDGKRIAFVSDRDRDQEIYVMDADGKNQTRLTKSPRDDNNPVWSPDGAQIAFVSWRDNNQDIIVMNADGTDQRQLTVNPAKAQCLKWPF